MINLSYDPRLQGRSGHRHRRTNSSSEIFLAAAAAAAAPRQPPSTGDSAQYASAQPLPRYSHSSSYGSQHHGSYSRTTPPPRPASASPTYPHSYQHGPPPYPTAARSAKRAPPGAPESRSSGPAADVAALSADDIERAFQAALQAQHTRSEYYQMEPPAAPWQETADHTYLHPLKREAPPRQASGGAGHYGAVPAKRGTSRSRRSASPVNRLASGAPQAPPPGAPPSGRHRRVRSNSPARQGNSRTTGVDPLLQRGIEVPLAYPSQRRRSIDAVSSQSPLGSRKSVFFPPIPPPQHRRLASAADSVRSDVSLMSYRSDIRKSTYFREYDSGTGQATLSYPNAWVHLAMSPSLEPGRVYAVPVPTSVYDDYFLALQEQEDGSLGFDFDLGNLNGCDCDCAQCATCRGKAALLPPRFYALGVREDLYRRVLDEICRSRNMPCGLFFCGFHEDVSRPSILLAVAVVACLLVAMAAAACYVAG